MVEPAVASSPQEADMCLAAAATMVAVTTVVTIVAAAMDRLVEDLWSQVEVTWKVAAATMVVTTEVVTMVAVTMVAVTMVVVTMVVAATVELVEGSWWRAAVTQEAAATTASIEDKTIPLRKSGPKKLGFQPATFLEISQIKIKQIKLVTKSL